MDNKDTLYARMLSGDLSQKEVDELKASGEWEEIEKIIDFSDNLSLPAYDKKSAFDNLNASLNKKTKASVRKLNPVWVVGIAASLILLIGFFLFLPGGQYSFSAEYATVMEHYLQDNSKVIINDGSRINYKSKNWARNRTVQLTGEAFFEVEKGSPFVVETDKGKVEVLGTSFNVRSWGEALAVECYTGKVQVTAGDQKVVLTPGLMVKMKDGENPETATFEHTIPHWQNEVSRFADEPLQSVLEELERQYNVQVDVVKTDKRFTGSFTHTSLETALDQICKPFGLDFEITPEKIRIY